MANFVALKAARDHRAGWDVRREGVAAGPPLAIYLSEETHVVSARAADMLGLGTDAVRRIPVQRGLPDRRRRAPSGHRARPSRGGDPPSRSSPPPAPSRPAPSTRSARSPTSARSEGLWFHVDAAYGGPAAFTDDLGPSFAGIERADSIAFDPHKWLYTPLTGGCVLVRDMQHLPDSFSVTATYTYQDKERTGRGIDGSQLGPQFSRGFWAFKVWVSLLAHGRRAYADRISHDAALARYLGDRATERPDFELACPVGLSICCFRYVPPTCPRARTARRTSTGSTSG